MAVLEKMRLLGITLGYNGRSVVDYVLSSSDLIQHVESFCICEPTILSDHCPWRFSLCSALVSNNRHDDSKGNNSNRINFVFNGITLN